MGSDVMGQEYDDQDQRLAVCVSIWDQLRDKNMNINDRLLSAIKSRQQKQTEFAYGVITADRYVRTLQEHIGSDACYKLASTSSTSFEDVMQKAAKTLVYSNPEMIIEVKQSDGEWNPEGIELPKNTLMAFRHILTSSRKDRDGDILRTKGAEVDPKMLLLWQHMHNMPIGKMIMVSDHTDKKLTLVSAIVDMNALCHDAAVMVDNGMARFSHGFRALDFSEIKAGPDETESSPSGFDVKRFEIMEESMVSVPANIDADTEEVFVSLIEGGKLTSPLMKEWGKSLRNKMSVMVPGTSIIYTENADERKLECSSLADLKAAADAGLIGGKEDENKPGSRGEERRENIGGTSEETNVTDEKQAEEEEAGGDEVKIKIDPKKESKAGRALSKANEGRIKGAVDAMTEVIDMENVPRAAKALLREASGGLGEVLSVLNDTGETDTEPDVVKAIGIVLTHADIYQQDTVLKTLNTFCELRKADRLIQDFHSLKGI